MLGTNRNGKIFTPVVARSYQNHKGEDVGRGGVTQSGKGRTGPLMKDPGSSPLLRALLSTGPRPGLLSLRLQNFQNNFSSFLWKNALPYVVSLSVKGP